MTLRDLPPINALAEARITERYTLAHALTMMHGTIPGGYVRDRAIDVAVELNLLCDLTRPDSRDAVARLVERFGDASDADKARHHRDNPGELEALALAVLA